MTNLHNLAESFREAVNRQDVDKVLTMFTEDAEFALVGISNNSAKGQMINVFEYDAGVNSKNRKNYDSSLYFLMIISSP